MDFLDDETRPKLLFQSRPSSAARPSPPSHSPTTVFLHNKPLVISCVTLSLLLIASSIFLIHSDLLRLLSLWLSLSLLLGPFAPPSITAGDIRVGRGEIVEFPSPIEDPSPVEESRKRRPKPKRSEDLGFRQAPNPVQKPDLKSEKVKESDLVEEKEWNEEDMELLRKLVVKNPVGKPRRWEVISEGFKGRHGVQSVIKAAKSMGEAKPEDSDAYTKFLRNRKAVDKRLVEEKDCGGENGAVWSSGEDVALLNALKAFPKEAAMRWERIAEAVPGRSKGECVKRLGELKKDFRSNKANADS